MFHDCSYVQGIKYQIWESNCRAAGSWSTPTQLLGIWACSHLSRTDATTWLNHRQPRCHCPHTQDISSGASLLHMITHISHYLRHKSWCPCVTDGSKDTEYHHQPAGITWEHFGQVVIESFQITIKTLALKVRKSKWLRSDPSKALPPDTWLLQIAGAASHWAPKCRPWISKRLWRHKEEPTGGEVVRPLPHWCL